MQKQEKTFLALLVVFAFLGMLAFSNNFFLDNAHALTQYFIGGLSNGKLIIAIAWLSLLPLTCLIALKAGIAERLEKKQGLFFAGFLVVASIIFATGLLQYYYFSSQFGNQQNFATLLKEDEYINWEASKLSHNHFPKIALYFLEKNLGINTGAGFDDGKPLFLVFPNPEVWGFLLAVLAILLVVFTILHSASKSRRINAFDFLLFALAGLSIAVHSLDGGIATGTIVPGIFLLFLYVFRNNFKAEIPLKHLLPLAFALVFFTAITALASIELLSVGFTIPLLLVLGFGYFLVKELQENRLKKNLAFNIAVIVVFALALNSALIMFNVFAEGRWIIDFSAEPSTKTSLNGDGLFIYGIPENAKTADLKAELEKFGKLAEFDRKGWTAYARIIPNSPFRTLALEKKLEEKFNPEGYFYVEESAPLINSGKYALYLLENEKPVKFDSEFLGLKVLKQEYDAEEHAIILSIQGKYDNTWQMLAILAEAKEKGLEKQALLVK